MRKTARAYRTQRGRLPVVEFLESLGEEARGRVEADIDFLEVEPGIEIGEPTYKHVKGPIWEVRTPTQEGAIRILFAIDGSVALLVHGIKKKRQRLDPRDIKLAEQRFDDYLRRKT